jgi:hypothetical protein
MYNVFLVCSTAVSGQINVGMGAILTNQMSTFSSLQEVSLISVAFNCKLGGN